MPGYVKFDGVDGSDTFDAEHFDFVEGTGGDGQVASLSLNFTKIEYKNVPMQGLGAQDGDGDWTATGFDLADGTSNTMEF